MYERSADLLSQSNGSHRILPTYPQPYEISNIQLDSHAIGGIGKQDINLYSWIWNRWYHTSRGERAIRQLPPYLETKLGVRQFRRSDIPDLCNILKIKKHLNKIII